MNDTAVADSIRVLARDDEGVVVALDDRALLHGLSELRWHLDDHVLGGARTLVVDLSGVERLSSATIAVLLRAQRRCRARGGRVVLRGPSQVTMRALRRTGLWQVFDVERAR